ncbi:hypothetical protein P873_06630 [Arenimonas composti TR7-09 = DSM 18010]|uniref:Peptidyl-prolyl cis-trans isomerase n=1 Tax=Arenimonas composti TR7-09 = DSM 18010 TaxID=1121013 RepID=A0A091BHU3_9GAMM|nr:hypothetical protein P873_06630 [Arenimonas composti TR7-09 = DSM 18010]
MAAFGLTAGVALAQTAPANNQPPPPPVNKPVLSYAIGHDLGSDLANNNVDVDINAVVRGLQEGFAKKAAPYSQQDMEAQLAGLTRRMMERAQAELQRVAAENKQKSDTFMAANRGKPGVTQLPSGVQYRVIEPGAGARPGPTSAVQVLFRASLHTGQEYASTYNQANPTPITMKIDELPLAGLKEVLQMMPLNARWEIFLPPDQAYGNDPRAPGGPGTALVFDIKVVSIQ